MTKRLKIFFLLLLSGLFVPAQLAAQNKTNSIVWRSYDYIKQSDARLTSENAALLLHLSDVRISKAMFTASGTKGGFVNYFQSPQSYTLGAETESFFSVNPRLVFYGLVGYDNFTGKQMGGSAFISPYSAPFNIVESTDTTRDTKQMETYRLIGAIGYALSKKTSIGFKADYIAANFAKRKDLRHRNKLFEFNVTLGLNYAIGKKMELGIDYFYRKRVEGVYFNIYGTTDKQYVSLIDFGGSYGRTQTFTEMGDGYTSGKTERPLTDNFHGGAIQLQWNFSPPVQLFNQFYYRHRKGYYGIPSSHSVVYTEHQGNSLGYTASGLLLQGNNRHRLDVGFESETLTNFENIYTIENEIGGMSYTRYHDKNKMLNQTRHKVYAEYTGNIDVRNLQPTWVWSASVMLRQHQNTTSVYPFFRKQNWTYWQTRASLNRNICNNKNCIGLKLGISYNGGNGNPFTDGLYAAPSTTELPPKTADFNLLAEYDYFTATQVGVHPELSCRIKLKAKTIGVALLHYDFIHAFRTLHLNHNRHQLSLSLGCEF